MCALVARNSKNSKISKMTRTKKSGRKAPRIDTSFPDAAKRVYRLRKKLRKAEKAQHETRIALAREELAAAEQAVMALRQSA